MRILQERDEDEEATGERNEGMGRNVEDSVELEARMKEVSRERRRESKPRLSTNDSWRISVSASKAEPMRRRLIEQG